MQVFFDLFSGIEDICIEFSIPRSELEGVEIIYASYEHANYEGWAHVIFLKDGKLWLVYGSHCSCNGLEDQWEPEETSIKALLMMKNEQLTGAIKERFKTVLAFI